MKKTILFCFTMFLLMNVKLNAQIGIGTNSPSGSAALELQSNNKGLLIPRLTESQKNAIATPATGLMIYQTDGTAGFYFYNGSAWTSLNGGGGTTLPAQTGNSGKVLTTDGTNLSWIHTPVLGGIQVVTCTSAATNNVSISNLNVRTILLDFQAASSNVTNTVVNLSLPSAASYPAGTTITISTTNTVTSGALPSNSGFTLSSPSSTLTAFGINNLSTASAVALPNSGENRYYRFITDGVSKWYRLN